MPSASRARVVANWTRRTGRPVCRAPRTVPRVVSMGVLGAFGGSWRSGEREGGGADVDAGVHLDPGLAVRLDRGHEDVLGLRSGRGGAGRRRVEHGPAADGATAAGRLDGLVEGPRLDTARPRGPGARLDLPVLRLELGPPDHPLRRIEPERPLRRVGRGHLVDAAEVSALVRTAIRAEVQLEETDPARQVEARQRGSAGAEPADR